MKQGEFTQLYIHLVFSVKNRKALLDKNIRHRVFEYMSAIITAMGHKSLIISGVNDHVHSLLGLNPIVTISNTVHDVKEAQHFLLTVKNYARGSSHGRRVTELFLTVGRN